MAVKAADQITMTDMTDVKSFVRYYLLQSSTLAAPAKPTTNPPSLAWSKTEPTYTAGSTNSLYFTDLTAFSNDTFSYSDVSLSSSYEAAKTAYNKAVEAAKTATNFISYDSTGGLQVGNKQSGSWAGTRTQQTASAFNILGAAGEVLASYGAALVELGKNAANAVIKLCAGAGSIRVEDKSDEGMFENTMCLSSDRVSLEGAEFAGVNAESLIISMGGITTPEGTTQLATQKYHRRTYFNAVNDDVGMGHGDAFVKIGASKTEETDDVTTYHAASSVLITPESINLQSDAVTVNGGALFLTKTTVLDNFSVSASSNKSLEVDVHVDGYVALGFMNIGISNASSDGKNVSGINLYGTHLLTNADGSCFASFLMRNTYTGTNTAKIKIEATVLYVREEMVGNLIEIQ